MTLVGPLLIRFVTLCLIGLSVTSASDLGSRSDGDQSAQTRPKRSTLHELLLRNRNIASSGPGPAKSGDDNQNRRVLVIGDGEEPPNYVYDDETMSLDDVIPDHELDEPAVSFVPDSDLKPADVGDQITNYATNFASNDEMSYADPSFLAAVMSQADKANFRYPINNNDPAKRAKDQFISESARIESTSGSKTNEINPFELFPPSFHELLEIPLHTYANGSSYSPHERKKIQPKGPIITGGYANTNVNGQVSSKEEESQKVEERPIKRIKMRRRRPSVKPQHRRRRPVVKEEQNIRIDVTEAPTTTTMEPSTMPSFVNQRKRIDYTDFRKKNNENNRLPPPSDDQKRRRPVRPSLRFRTRAPITAPSQDLYTTTPLPETTTTPALTTSTPELSTVQFSPKFTPLNEITKVETTDRDEGQSTHILRENNEFNIPNRPSPPQPVQISAPDHSVRVQENLNRRRPIFHISNSERKNPPRINAESNYKIENYDKKENLYPDNESSYVNSGHALYINDIVTSTQPPSSPKHEFSNGNIYVKETLPDDFLKINENFPKDIYKLTPTEATVQPSRPIKNDFKQQTVTKDFKPSKIDPFFDKPLTYSNFLNSKPYVEPITARPTIRPIVTANYSPLSIIRASTYRPHITHLTSNNFDEVLPPVVNTYEIPSNANINYYQDNIYRDAGRPFTNSHTIRKPYSQPPKQYQRPFIERGIPVYSTSFRNDPHIFKDHHDRIDRRTPLRTGFQPPPSDMNRKHSSRFPYDNANRRIYRPQQNNRRPQTKRRPSFLEKLGFFRPKQLNRRTGESDVSVEINDITNTFDKPNKKPTVDYVLTNGPPPFNGKKVIVMGPFKEPPIGAPLIYPKEQTKPFKTTQRSLSHVYDVNHPSSILHASSRSNPLTKNSMNKKFMNTEVKAKNISNHVFVHSQFKTSEPHQEGNRRSFTGNNAIFSNGINRSQIPYPNREPNSISFSKFNSTVPSNVYHREVDHQNYHLFQEVSPEDKERLIAAKFEFPRESSVRRSGLERHVIPIPVPMISSNGEQISKFQNIQVPHVPLSKKIGRTPIKKHIQNLASALFSFKKDTPLEAKDINENRAVTLNPLLINRQTPMRITSYPVASSTEIPRYKEPESYREPTSSNLNFEGWQIVEPKDEAKRKISSKSLKPDKDMVRFSSKLNVDAPGIVRSFLVDPPRVL